MWSPESVQQSDPVPPVEDHLLVHQFIREFGRRPTAKELAAYQRAAAVRRSRRLSTRLALARALSRL